MYRIYTTSNRADLSEAGNPSKLTIAEIKILMVMHDCKRRTLPALALQAKAKLDETRKAVARLVELGVLMNIDDKKVLTKQQNQEREGVEDGWLAEALGTDPGDVF
jgi:hypothetical protein